ncbi:response regulator [filamentous cyanobacterium CCP5]|nr:response regulator [filamentous cyanobacterium CCP5]
MSGPPLNTDRRKRVLLVEDDSTNRLLFTDYLSRQSYQVMALPDGTTLLEEIERFQPDVLLIDVGLPYIDGLTLLRRLRAIPRWQNLPAIVMSTYVFQSDYEPVASSSIKYYLAKPVRLENLSSLLKQLLSENDPEATT